jgi:tetratricopeptide (TPR) repeat protein
MSEHMNSEAQENEKPEAANSDNLDSQDPELMGEENVRKPMNNISRPYMRDNLFTELMSHYQNADWEASLDAIERLSKLYPGETSLDDFREDIIMRADLYKKGDRSKKVESRVRFQQRSGLLIVGVIAIVAIFFGIRWGISQYQEQSEASIKIAEATNQAIALQTRYENAESYLLADRPEEALPLFEDIQVQSPGYADVEEKIIEAQALIELHDLYQQGVQYFQDNELDTALEILTTVNQQRINYRDVPQLIAEIENRQQVSLLTEEISDSFQVNDWEAVILNYETILEIDPNFEIPEIKDELFLSYMNSIIDIADRPDATLEDIDTAERYYRDALAIFPQSRDYADERAELEEVATNLIVNKYHIYAVTLIETEHYSIQSIQQALRILQRAISINPDSLTVESDISTLEAYATAFNHLVQRNYDDAIDEFNNLLRLEPDFGDGRITYLLYEAHIARGDLFLMASDFASALEDYEDAEAIAWGEGAGTLQLFEVEVRIGTALRRLSLYLESSEYFHYAANLVNLREYIDPDQSEVLQAFDDAQLAYLRGESWEASRLYDQVYQEVDLNYPYQTVGVTRGDSLIDLSFLYGSTIEAIQVFNSLGDTMEARMDQDLLIPSFDEE